VDVERYQEVVPGYLADRNMDVKRYQGWFLDIW
jgi:hypothetical protein